jgi:hypothetical protein
MDRLRPNNGIDPLFLSIKKAGLKASAESFNCDGVLAVEQPIDYFKQSVV